VFGSSVGCRGGAVKLLLVHWHPGLCMKILAFAVICMVIVMAE